MKSNGKHFSAGHDMSSTDKPAGERQTESSVFDTPEGHYDWETRH